MELWLIEDDDAQKNLFCLFMKESHPKVSLKTFASGNETLEAFMHVSEKTVPAPLLILSDHQLLDMTGLELLKKLKSSPKFKNVPFVIYSGSRDQKTIDEAYDAGINAYLEKPESLEDYKEFLSSLIGFWSKVLY